MQIRGKEIRFLRTVKATSDIAKLCPDNDIQRIDELFSGDLPTTLEVGAKIIHYLNEGYEMNRHFSEPDYQPSILSVDEILYLDDITFTELMKSAMAGMNNGAEQLVEVEQPKKEVNRDQQ